MHHAFAHATSSVSNSSHSPAGGPVHLQVDDDRRGVPSTKALAIVPLIKQADGVVLVLEAPVPEEKQLSTSKSADTLPSVARSSATARTRFR